MKEMMKKGISIGLGLAITSKEQAEKMVDELVKKGELSKSESKEYIDDLIQRGEETQKELDLILKQKLKPLLDELNVATKEDIQRLEHRIAQIENHSNQLE